jgi:hypothetical protein
MPTRVGAASLAARAGCALAALGAGALLAGCGGGTHPNASLTAPTRTPAACAAAVVKILRGVGARIYHEGVLSERTASARYLITHSRALSHAVERGDSSAARAAANELIATGHMVSLTVLRGASVLARAGTSRALAPLSGQLIGAGGAPIGSFIASVWSNSGLIAETTGVTGAETVIRHRASTVDGKFPLPPRRLQARGTLSAAGEQYAYTSFPASEYPDGGHLRVYLVRSFASTSPLCGPNVEETTVKTLAHVATQLYLGEAGSRAQVEVRRVQSDEALRRAVTQRSPQATRRAVQALLTEHIVRLRVSAEGRLLADVGGPFVLAPVSATLHEGGRKIGEFVLSIQDDEGYLRLMRRLAGMYVLMYMGPALVKNSLGPDPGSPPAEGRYQYRARMFRTVTLHAEAFPSSPLRIVVLIPIPYA